MKRREFLTGAAAGAGAAAATAAAGFPAPAIAQERHEWRMVTTWPKGFPVLGTAAERVAQRITEMSEGRLTVKVYAAGELVPPLESMDAVSRGAAEMAHSTPYYWFGKHKALAFFTGVPFGLTAGELTAWIRHMGGQELWDEIYDGFGLKGFSSGNTSVQAGGWFRNPVESLDDLQGLKFRTPGLGGEVWKKLGVTTVNLPAGEVFQALQSGALDATEFVGPYNDLALGLYKVAQNYYFPGFNEPGQGLEVMVNKEKFNALPKDLQRIVEVAAQADFDQVLGEYFAKDPQALQTLVNEHGVQVRTFPEPVMQAAGQASKEVMQELYESSDDLTKRVIDSFRKARGVMAPYQRITDMAYMKARDEAFSF